MGEHGIWIYPNNLTGVNRLTCVSTDLLYTAHALYFLQQPQVSSELVLANQRTCKSFDGVSGATRARVWAVSWCFLPRYFHSRVEIQCKATCPTLSPILHQQRRKQPLKKTWAPAQSHQMTTFNYHRIKEVDFTAYWELLLVLLKKYRKI